MWFSQSRTRQDLGRTYLFCTGNRTKLVPWPNKFCNVWIYCKHIMYLSYVHTIWLSSKLAGHWFANLQFKFSKDSKKLTLIYMYILTGQRVIVILSRDQFNKIDKNAFCPSQDTIYSRCLHSHCTSFYLKSTLKSIHWEKSSARSSFFEKGIILTKPFQPSQSWHQLSFFEKGIIVQNFLLSEWALLQLLFEKRNLLSAWIRRNLRVGRGNCM